MDKKIEKLLITHANIDNKKECCGFIVLDNLKQLIIIPCENTYEFPSTGFRICPHEFLNIKKRYEIVCMYHSHPIGPAEFSQKDLDQADELCLPICVYSIQENNFNIFFPKSYGVKPFIGREYIHHFQNCWKLIYDYYDSKNMLANRDFNFYLEQNANKTFSEDVVFKIKTFFKKNNIKKQATVNMTRDDLIIFQKQSGVFSHFGVFLENDEFLHHQEGLLSSKNIMNDEFYKKVHSIYRIANN